MDNEILIPKMGWSIDEATFVEWLKSNGEYVNAGDELFSVESDKAVQAVESIDSGWLCIEHDLPKEGQLLKYGTVIGYLSEKKTNSKVTIKLENSEDYKIELKTEDADEDTKNKIDNLDYKNEIPEGKNELIASDRVFITPRAKSLAKKFDLDLNKKSKQLSKGNKQKIGIIQAFCHDPEILILDEPTSGLDPLKQQEFDELILKYKEKGKTIFISSHVLPEVEMLCDRVAIIKNGKIVAENTMAQLKSMAINRFEVIFKNEVPERKFGKSIGVKNISKSGEKFIFDVEGDVNKFIKKISENKVISFRSMEPDLEEIFLSFYKKNKLPRRK